ncbi:hypothetical protein GCM10009648_37550 [Tsukamurella spumae]
MDEEHVHREPAENDRTRADDELEAAEQSPTVEVGDALLVVRPAAPPGPHDVPDLDERSDARRSHDTARASTTTVSIGEFSTNAPSLFASSDTLRLVVKHMGVAGQIL